MKKRQTMHIHDLNPWKTIIVLTIFVAVIAVGFFTLPKPLLTYQLDISQSIEELNNEEALFFPSQLDSFLTKKMKNVVLFDIRDNFIYGQGHIPGAENMSANDLTQEANIERLQELKNQNYTVVLYGDNQLQANGPWMLFRQTGYSNVKILLGGYQYYLENKDNLVDLKTNNGFLKEIPRYNYTEMAAPNDGSEMNIAAEKKPVIINRRQRTSVVAGGC